MGSLRNPIGPLPSTIYWRRRAVALALLALLAVPVVWALSTGGGDKGSNEGKGGGHGPASSITPGPTDSGPAITQRPGGRDQEDGGGGGSTGGGDSGSGGAGSVGGAGGGGSTGGAGAAGGGSPWVPAGNSSGGSGSSGASGGGDSGGGGGSGSGGSGDAPVPAGSSLPDCGSSGVTVSLHSEHKTYAKDQRPKFKLAAVNKRGTACKMDLGRKATTVTVNDSGGKKVWSSDDCTEGAKPALVQVPASGKSTHTFTWYRKPSAENCGTPPSSSAPSGSYKIEVVVQGLKKATAKFKLA